MLNFPNSTPAWTLGAVLLLLLPTPASHAGPSFTSPPAPPTPEVTGTQQGLLPPDATPTPLEMFVVALPPRASRPGGTGRSQTARVSPGRWSRPIVQNRLNGEITYSAFPGLEPLLLDMGGDIGGRQVQSHLDPNHLLQSDTLSRNSLQFSREGQGMEIGGDNGGVPGAGPGLRLFTPIDDRHGALGLGLYQRLSTGGFSLLPGVDTQWHPSMDLDLDLALAADSSLRLTQQSRIRGWMAQSFLGWDARQGRSQATLSLGRQWKDTSLFMRLSRFSGTDSRFAWEQGLTRRIGPASLTMDTSLSHQSGSSLQQTRLGLIRPLGRNLLSVRWEWDHTTGIASSQKSTQLNTMLTMPMRNDTLIFMGDSLLTRSGSPNLHQTTVSASWNLGRLWSLQTGITRDWQAGRQRLNAAIGIWVTPDWQVRLLVGPSLAGGEFGQQSPVSGFQIVHRFGLTTFAAGTVRGRVLLQGRPCTQPVQLQLEDRVVCTDSQGRFQFDHVPVGPHDIGFNLSSFPATLDAAEMSQTVQVQQGKTIDLVFSALQVGQVRGRVEVGADAFGQTDQTAGLGIVITDGQGHETTTDADLSFTLGNLPLGRHTISLLPSSLPPGYEIISAGAQGVDVADKVATPTLVFRIAPRRQQVEMTSQAP